MGELGPLDREADRTDGTGNGWGDIGSGHGLKRLCLSISGN